MTTIRECDLVPADQPAPRPKNCQPMPMDSARRSPHYVERGVWMRFEKLTLGELAVLSCSIVQEIHHG